MSAYSDIAAELQRGVKYDEMANLESGLDQYGRAAIRQSMVHTRHDVVLVVSLLDSLNLQIRALRWTAFLILGSLWLHWWRG